jgi:hypothetical protein
MHDLRNDIFQDDKMQRANDIDHDIGLQAQLDAAWGQVSGTSFGSSRRVSGFGQLGAQIVGFEVIAVFTVPLPALPAMMFFPALGSATGLLSANLPQIRQKPFSANHAGSLACACSWHRALSYVVDLMARYYKVVDGF